MILTAHLIFFVIPDGHSTISAANDIKQIIGLTQDLYFFVPFIKMSKITLFVEQKFCFGYKHSSKFCVLRKKES